MVFIKTFKGYEDKTLELDKQVNDWLQANASHITKVLDIKMVLSHEPGSRAGSGDLLYAVLYDSGAPVE